MLLAPPADNDKEFLMARFSAAVGCVFACLWVAGLSAQPTPKPATAGSTSGASVGNIDVQPRADGLTITIVATAPVTPASSRASNPDRIIFDFSECELKGGNRHIPVNRGPVKEVRASLFSNHPPATRVVVESTESLNFEIKPAANGAVVIEIPFRKSEASPVATASNTATRARTRR